MNQTKECGYCGSWHGTKCPLVKAYEYNQDGTIKRVEFYSPADYQPVLTVKGDPLLPPYTIT